MLSFQRLGWRVFWKSTLSKLLFSTEIFLDIYELGPSLMLKIKLIRSVRSFTISNKTNIFKCFLGGSSLLDPPPTRLLNSACLVVKKWIPCPGSLSSYCKSLLIQLLWQEFLNRKTHKFITKVTRSFVKLVIFIP